MHNDLGDHRVVIRRHHAALLNSIVNADSGSLQRILRLPPQYRASLWGKAGVGIFYIQACFDGMPRQFDFALLQWQWMTSGDAQLPLHQIKTGNHFCDRMLHLQARIHLQKVVVQVLIHDEFNRTGTAVTHRQGSSYSVFTHRLAHGG